ncbi:hypothetical protein NHF50_07440 [Flavobacterium sp. NRK F10]|uniref:hypothetical protein n=1 Tax=Flavobacterium sp. NRK F10 TaxID=2954931 RepID=UPI0020904BDC|nr:hypothetical protein [Flavobacterium sp. NRK F10]MCO6174877.1 hypothetical protein [Flavobacterium sp. NRK F10]
MKKLMIIATLILVSCNSVKDFTKDGILEISSQNKVQVSETTFLKIEKIVLDSRCPKGVACVRAGEVKLILGVYDETDHSEVLLTLDPLNFETNKKFLESRIKLNDQTISAIHVYPEKVAGQTIVLKDYWLKIILEKKN